MTTRLTTLLCRMLLLSLAGLGPASAAAAAPPAAPELAYFRGKAIQNVVVLEWALTGTAALDTLPPGAGFIVQRSEDGQHWQTTGRARPDSSHRASFVFRDHIEKAYRYYRLRLFSAGSLGPVLGTTFIDLQVAEVFFTARPKRPEQEVLLHYRLDGDRRLLLRIFDQVGQEVRTQLVPSGEAGVYDVPINFSGQRPGVYLLVLTQEDRNLDLAETRIEY